MLWRKNNTLRDKFLKLIFFIRKLLSMKFAHLRSLYPWAVVKMKIERRFDKTPFTCLMNEKQNVFISSKKISRKTVRWNRFLVRLVEYHEACT